MGAEGDIPDEARAILRSLASYWADVADPKAMQVVRLKGAMTNKVYQIKWSTDPGEQSRKVLVRIYGEGVEVFFDREDEIRAFECMSRHGQGPRLLGRFANGRVEEFIHARTLSAADLRDVEISALIAAKLREFHGLEVPGPMEIILWDRLRNWLGAAKSVCPPEEAKMLRLEVMDEEVSCLEEELRRGNHQCIGFCHNDLQYGNIMMDEETRSITIIDYEYAGHNPVELSCPQVLGPLAENLGFIFLQDYEYAGHNPVAYDIANHFCEMAADYHTDTPHILDFTKYPGDEPGDFEVEELLQDIRKYTLASHLLWGLWGIISAHVNKIDFDYMEYARQRFQQYWLTKPVIVGSSDAHLGRADNSESVFAL